MPELRVRRDDLASCEIVDEGPSAELADGEVRLRVERFALTSNNVSSALLGDELGIGGSSRRPRVGPRANGQY